MDAETRRRVLRCDRGARVRPSPTARRLSLGRTWTVDVVASYLTRPQAIERLRGAESVLGDSGFDLVIHNVETPERRERYLRELPASNRTDGVLLVSAAAHVRRPSPPGRWDRFRSSSSTCTVQAVEGLPVVRGDDVAGGALAGRYLFTLGHRAIGFVADSFDNPYGFTSSRDRYAGFTDVLRELGRRGRGLHSARTDRGARASSPCGC